MVKSGFHQNSEFFHIFLFQNMLNENFIIFRYDVMYVYLYNYAEIDLKFDSADATWLIGMIGILNTVGEVLVGWLGMILE